jgi:hypothetical protein
MSALAGTLSRMGSTLWLPGQVEERREFICRVITDGEGTMCSAIFHDQQEWQRHVGRCAREHIEEIRAQSLAKRMPVFDPETWDPEWDRHMRKVGRRMKQEGRLVPHRHER